MSTRNENLLRDLEEARERGDEHGVTEALVDLAERTPLFAAHLAQVREWIEESRDLAVRTVLRPRQEVLTVLRSAEVFLVAGAARSAFDVATEGCHIAALGGLFGLEDRAWMVEPRALVRLGRQDDAVQLFEKIVDRELPPEDEEPIVPGLAFLAVGEAHLFEGRYNGAHGPLERAIGLLPPGHAADRLRYDALVGLGMLDHRRGDFALSAHRYHAAMQLADAHESRPEQVESLLLMGSLLLGQGDRRQAHEHLRRAIALSAELDPPLHALSFPTERLRNVVGRRTTAEMIDAATELAWHCGAENDLMGYVQLTAIVASLIDLDGRPAEARDMLEEVAVGLEGGGQAEAATVVRRHLTGYSA